MKYFTTYWKNDTWKRRAEEAKHGNKKIDYAAADCFKKRGVERGSVVFIVTDIEGVMFLGGYIKVHEILDINDAARYLGKSEDKLRQSKDYVVAERGKEIDFIDNYEVPLLEAKKLMLINGKGFKPLLYDKDKLKQQTLRYPARILCYNSGELLLSLLHQREGRK